MLLLNVMKNKDISKMHKDSSSEALCIIIFSTCRGIYIITHGDSSPVHYSLSSTLEFQMVLLNYISVCVWKQVDEESLNFRG